MDHYELNFEWDEAKSAANLEKHGMDFYEARDVWRGDFATVRLPSRGERRSLAIGRLSGELWSIVYTMRGERKRIISARRSTPAERSSYDRHANQ